MSEERTCPNCGAALMPSDIFCGECGARVQTPTYSTAPDEALDDASSEFAGIPLAAEPTAGEYIPPPPAKRETSGDTALRIVVIVLAVGFLIASLCFCSFGGFALIPTEESPTVAENFGFATTLCFVPGVILGLLGAGAAYWGFRKR
jgi:hypothetical protein